MRVSVIISNRNDLSMLSVTVRSVLEELSAVPGGGEVVIVDNSDEAKYKALADGSFIAKEYFRRGNVRLYRQDYPCLFTAREEAARRALGQYLVCLDSHMIVGHNMIKALVDFMNSRKNDPKLAFAHAPISWCHQHESHAKHSRDVTRNELGPWDARYTRARKITWKGMPWIVRKDFFINTMRAYGALAQHKISWGGGDMHIGVKPWLLGYENWAVPCRPAIHIGPFPKEAQNLDEEYKYRLYSNSGNYPASFGFLLSCYILGGDAMVERNLETIKTRFGWKVDINKHVKIAKQLGQEEKAWLDANKVMSFEEWLANKPWENNDADESLQKSPGSSRNSGPVTEPVVCP